MDKIIGQEIGGCLIESCIGQGGMGIVYKAHHHALDITVALKLLHPLLPHSGDIERFLREARVAARLRHPNIVGVLNVGSEEERHFLVTNNQTEQSQSFNTGTNVWRGRTLDISARYAF